MPDAESHPGNVGLIRVGGIAVLLALALHIYLNGVLKQFPDPGFSPAELRAYLAAEADTWAIVHGFKYLALLGLALFGAGAYARVSRPGSVARPGWGIVGLLGTGLHVTNAVIANGIEVMAFYDFSRLSENADLFWLLFNLVRVLFTAEIVAWGLTAFGFSMAGLQSGTLPRWICWLGFVCAGACLVSGVSVVSVLREGWAAPVMGAAELLGLIWFAATGVFLLVRGDS